MIYRPAQTLLLQSAKAAGCRAANGIGMLLYQGAKALEIWTGQPAPIDAMRQALEKMFMADILLDCSRGGQPTKAAEDSRFGFFTRGWNDSEITFARQQYSFASLPRLQSPPHIL